MCNRKGNRFKLTQFTRIFSARQTRARTRFDNQNHRFNWNRNFKSNKQLKTISFAKTFLTRQTLNHHSMLTIYTLYTHILPIHKCTKHTWWKSLVSILNLNLNLNLFSALHFLGILSVGLYTNRSLVIGRIRV